MNGKKFGLVFLVGIAAWHAVGLIAAGDWARLMWLLGLTFIATTLI